MAKQACPWLRDPTSLPPLAAGKGGRVHETQETILAPEETLFSELSLAFVPNDAFDKVVDHLFAQMFSLPPFF